MSVSTSLPRATAANVAPSNSHRSAKSPLKAACLALGGLGLLVLSSCSAASGEGTSASAESASVTGLAEGKGQLQIRANGEDFVRDGFTSKDGWEMRFDHLYVGLADVSALQTDPPFDPDGETSPSVTAQLKQPQTVVVDLADDANPTALVAEFSAAQAGRYNALEWSTVPASSGPSSGQSLQLVGQATKEGETIGFTLNWDQSYEYACGDFIGDQRKGILKGGDRADLEATFHFDHVFGDGEAAPDDDINQKALGFSPLAELAGDGSVALDRAALEQQLSPADFEQLSTAIAGLAHVGEGHCQLVASGTDVTASAGGEVSQ